MTLKTSDIEKEKIKAIYKKYKPYRAQAWCLIILLAMLFIVSMNIIPIIRFISN